MYKIIKYVSLTVAALLCYACDEELKDELFEKQVLLTKNGWIEQTVDITESNQFDLPIAVSINGTTGNDRNVNVQLKFDSENLANYNFEKYRRDSSLYYRELPADVVSFKAGSDKVTVPNGDIRAVSHISLDISKLDDIYGDYVIPVSIDSVSAYKKAPVYHKALHHVVLKNKYSGNYTGQLAVYKTKKNGDNDGEPIPVTTKTLYAIGKQQCFFYAAHYDRSEWERDKYIINMTVDENETISLTALNSDLELVQESATTTTAVVQDKTDSRYEIHSTEINLSYKISLPLLSPQYPVRVEGKITKTERILKKQQ
jgi:hypothetical protein